MLQTIEVEAQPQAVRGNANSPTSAIALAASEQTDPCQGQAHSNSPGLDQGCQQSQSNSKLRQSTRRIEAIGKENLGIGGGHGPGRGFHAALGFCRYKHEEAKAE